MCELTEEFHHSKDVQFEEVYQTILLEEMEANVEQRPACIGVHMYVRTYIYTYIHTHICIYVRLCLKYIGMYIHIGTYVHVLYAYVQAV